MNRKYACGHDPRDFVVYMGDEWNYHKETFSLTAQEQLMAALLAHWQKLGRDVSLMERFPEPTEGIDG